MSSISIKIFDVDFDEKCINKWFSVDNYVKFLCDKIRSDVKRGVKKYSIQDFYHNYSEIVRSLIFNDKDSRVFEDNGMILKDVDVLSIHVDENIKCMLEDNQYNMIKNMLSLQLTEENFKKSQREIEIQKELDAQKHAVVLAREENSRALTIAENRFTENEQRMRLQARQEQDKINGEIEAKQLERTKAQEDQRLEIQNREIEQKAKENKSYAETVSKIMGSVSEDLIAAMQNNSNAETLRVVAEAMAPLAIARGESVAETVNTLMRGTSLENVIKNIKENSK